MEGNPRGLGLSGSWHSSMKGQAQIGLLPLEIIKYSHTFYIAICWFWCLQHRDQKEVGAYHANCVYQSIFSI